MVNEKEEKRDLKVGIILKLCQQLPRNIGQKQTKFLNWSENALLRGIQMYHLDYF